MLYDLPASDRAGQRRLARYRARRAVTARARRSEHAAQEPTVAKLRYMKGLRKVVRSLWDVMVRAHDLDRGPPVTNQRTGLQLAGHERADARDPVRVQVLETVRRDVPDLTARAARDVSGHNARQMRRLVGVDPRVDPGTGPVIDTFREENLRLITNLSEEMLDRVGAIVKDFLGGRVEDLADELQKGLDFSESRANLVARDQTLKLNGQLTRVRQQNAGISEYVWTTSRDERVRPEHQDLDGQTFRWDNPPSPGHPGEDYQCRCTAYPVIPGLGEEEESDES